MPRIGLYSLEIDGDSEDFVEIRRNRQGIDRNLVDSGEMWVKCSNWVAWTRARDRPL